MISAPPTTTIDPSGNQVPNPAHHAFIRQDAALASWLLQAVSTSVLLQLVGYESVHLIWSQLGRSFAQKSSTKLMHYRRLLHWVKKGDTPMRDYINKAKSICDSLTVCGQTLSEEEHISALLNGLSSEFEPIVAIVYASPTIFNLDTVTTILMDAEARQRDSFAQLSSFTQLSVSANLATKTSSSSSNPPQFSDHYPSDSSNASLGRASTFGSIGSDASFGSRSYSEPTFGTRSFPRPSTRGTLPPWARGRGRSSNSRIQCQWCGKPNHLTVNCYFLRNQVYPSPAPNFKPRFQQEGWYPRRSPSVNLMTSNPFHPAP